MKSLIAAISLLLIASSTGNAQFKKGDVEFSFSGSAGSWARDHSENYTSGSSNSNSGTRMYGFFALCPGYYLVNGLSAEPEVNLIAISHDTPIEYLLLGVSYTYLRPNSKIAPFIRLGYGVSNSLQMPGMTVYPDRFCDKLGVSVVNVGAGAKFLLTRSILFRTELNYKTHGWSMWDNSGSESHNSNYHYSFIGLLFGFSIII